MKKTLILSALIASFSSLSAYDYNIKKGWNQFGAMSNITDLSVFNKKDCVDYLWRYDNSKDTPIWKLHIANDVDYAYSGEILQSLKPTEGFWLKASSSCTVTINTPDLPPAPPELDGNDNETVESHNGNYKSCNDILKAGKSKGDGVYTIDPDLSGDIQPFEAYCDMTTDNGGWTLVVQQSTNGKNIDFDGKDSNYNECLLNNNKDCTELSFLSKQIKGTSYMKQIGNSELIVTRFNDNKQRTWWDMSANIPESELNKNVISTYFVSNPNITFKGFGGDWSYAEGCQDSVSSLGFTWYEDSDTHGAFAHSAGNAPCENNNLNYMISGASSLAKEWPNGAHFNTIAIADGWYKYGFVYVK